MFALHFLWFIFFAIWFSSLITEEYGSRFFFSPNRIYTKKTPARYRRSVDIKITYETASIHEIKNYNMDTVAIEQQGRRIKFASS